MKVHLLHVAVLKETKHKNVILKQTLQS